MPETRVTTNAGARGWLVVTRETYLAGEREIEQEMTNEPLIVARRHIDVDHRVRAGGPVWAGRRV